MPHASPTIQPARAPQHPHAQAHAQPRDEPHNQSHDQSRDRSPTPRSSDTVGRHAGVRVLEHEPYYVPLGDEVALFAKCHERGLAVMLKGPTGCGKTRFVEHMA